MNTKSNICMFLDNFRSIQVVPRISQFSEITFTLAAVIFGRCTGSRIHCHWITSILLHGFNRTLLIWEFPFKKHPFYKFSFIGITTKSHHESPANPPRKLLFVLESDSNSHDSFKTEVRRMPTASDGISFLFFERTFNFNYFKLV